jgi:ABC-type nitrate/sulfonate/bicarbonate transport system permease component
MPAVIEREFLSTGEVIKRKIFSWERLAQVLLVVSLLVAWEIAGRVMGEFFMAPPSSLPSAFGEMWASGELIRALLDSLSSLVVGFTMAVVVGVGVGFFMGWYGPAGRTLNPFVSALYVVPTAALVPMFIIWFGLGFTARTVTVFLFCIFEILVSTYTGVRNVDRNLVDAARAFGASGWQLFSRVVAFASLPYIFAGLRMGMARAVKGMVVAELLFAVTGLGGLISNAANYYRTDKVFIGVIVLAMLGVILAGAIQLLESRLMPWRRNANP